MFANFEFCCKSFKEETENLFYNIIKILHQTTSSVIIIKIIIITTIIITITMHFSVPTAIEKHSQNVPYADERHIVLHFVNVRIGQVIRWNV